MEDIWKEALSPLIHHKVVFWFFKERCTTGDNRLDILIHEIKSYISHNSHVWSTEDITPFSAKLALFRGTCNTTSVPMILYATVHNTSGTTKSNLSWLTPVMMSILKTKWKTKNKKIDPSFVGCTIAFSVCNKPFKPLGIP